MPIYTEHAIEQLAMIETKYLSVIEEAIEQQLSFEPFVPIRNRKPLRRPTRFDEAWELRCSTSNEFRIIYRPQLLEPDETQAEERTDIAPDSHVVQVVATLAKKNNRYYAGKEEFEL